MPFQVSTASSPADVIAQIVAFAIANGFTSEGTTVVTDTGFSPSRAVTLTRISKSGIYWTFRVDPRFADGTRFLQCRMSYSIASGAYPSGSNGQAVWTSMSLWGFPGPYPNLYLFCDGVTPAVHVALELTNGIFNHMSFGQIEKTETFTGGEYCTAGQYQYRDPSSPFLYSGWGNLNDSSNQPYMAGSVSAGSSTTSLEPSNGASYIRAVYGSASNNSDDFAQAGAYKSSSTATYQHASFSGYSSLLDPLIRDSPNSATLRTPLFPLHVLLRDQTSGLWRIVGRMPGVRCCCNLYVDNAEVILSDWQVFPMTQRFGDRTACPDSYKRAFAYKRVS
jgi:hypothetical protein